MNKYGPNLVKFGVSVVFSFGLESEYLDLDEMLLFLQLAVGVVHLV